MCWMPCQLGMHAPNTITEGQCNLFTPMHLVLSDFGSLPRLFSTHPPLAPLCTVPKHPPKTLLTLWLASERQVNKRAKLCALAYRLWCACTGARVPEQQVRVERVAAGAAGRALPLRPLLQPAQPGRERWRVPAVRPGVSAPPICHVNCSRDQLCWVSL